MNNISFLVVHWILKYKLNKSANSGICDELMIHSIGCFFVIHEIHKDCRTVSSCKHTGFYPYKLCTDYFKNYTPLCVYLLFIKLLLLMLNQTNNIIGWHKDHSPNRGLWSCRGGCSAAAAAAATAAAAAVQLEWCPRFLCSCFMVRDGGCWAGRCRSGWDSGTGRRRRTSHKLTHLWKEERI